MILVKGSFPVNSYEEKELQENEIEFQRKKWLLPFIKLRKRIYISRILISLSFSQLEKSNRWPSSSSDDMGKSATGETTLDSFICSLI